MSRQLIARSADLRRITEEGYSLEIRSNYLLMKDIPYVNGRREIKTGVIVSSFSEAGDVVAAPDDHTVYFVGEHPCDADGAPLSKIVIGTRVKQLGPDLIVQYRFSSKPVGTGKYDNFYDKLTSYVAMLSSHAQAIDPTVCALTGAIVVAEETESPFLYRDTASSRATINMVSKKLELRRIAIVGLGGTGSYVLDLVAKAPIWEIHLFDGDDMLSHNAFRAPGAVSIEQLRVRPKKVAYLETVYSAMRRGICAHPMRLDATNVHDVKGMDFVFLCMDPGDAKRNIVESLEKWGTPFIDVGMGLGVVSDAIEGLARVTMSAAGKRDHFRARASLAPAGDNAEYDLNIQIADLNALNAALAVIRFKKHFGFYADFGKELNTTYNIDTNALINEDASE